MMLHLFVSFALLLGIMISDATELEKMCSGLPRAFYHRSSCFVGSSVKEVYNTASTKCTQLPQGHLAFVTTSKTLAKYNKERNLGTLVNDVHFIGLYQAIITNEPRAGWAWRWNSTQHWFLPKWNMVMWHAREPDNNAPYGWGDYGAVGTEQLRNGMLLDADQNKKHYLCQYDEPRTGKFKLVNATARGHEDTVMSESVESSIFDCGRKCKHVPVCDSFSYNKHNGTCLLQWLDGLTLTQLYGPIHDEMFEMYRVI